MRVTLPVIPWDLDHEADYDEASALLASNRPRTEADTTGATSLLRVVLNGRDVWCEGYRIEASASGPWLRLVLTGVPGALPEGLVEGDPHPNDLGEIVLSVTLLQIQTPDGAIHGEVSA